ncbi:MAG: hypothetical protein HC765_06755 [Brachymonas sp.]|nr:hypothetical protein [Brachymonas sp.]
MKLDQKQMLIVSQLFMAAGKAGKSFDLKRFTTDAAYASETMAQLALHADQVRDENLQSLVVIAIEQMASVTMPAPLASPAADEPSLARTPAAPLASPAAPAAPVEQMYVGRLR